MVYSKLLMEVAYRARRNAHHVAVTLRCGLSCTWCHCRGSDGPVFEPNDDNYPDISERMATAVRFIGGDPFASTDLEGWVEYARKRTPRIPLEVEGPGASLVDPTAVDRLAALGLDRIRIRLPATDRTVLAATTGDAQLAERTFQAIRLLLDRKLSVDCVVPVNRLTARTLAATVLEIAGEFGSAVPILLERAPLRKPDGSIEMRPPGPWAEIETLSQQLTLLPPSLPGGARLYADDDRNWPACTLPVSTWRKGFLPVRTMQRALAEPGPVGEVCDGCGFRRRCSFVVHQDGPPPVTQMQPLDEEQAIVLERLSGDDEKIIGRLKRIDRGSLGLPEMLCFAPWTTLTLYSRLHHPVPCAPAWVDTKMTSFEEARELNASRLRTALANGVMRLRKGHTVFDPSNEDWSLADMWNGPMYRQMRGEMAPGGRSHRCRDSCRVILGVEERGINFFERPDSDLEPRVAANRARLRDEICGGATRLEATPLELTLGVSAHCNFTCGFCAGPEGKYGELSERRLAEVIAWLPGLMQLTVVGPGEPLMSVTFRTLLERIAMDGYPSLTVSLTTNGTLARPSWVKRHANIRWGQIRFSINSGSAATHERMTGKRLFDQLLENIEAVAELRSERSEPFPFVLSCVLSKFIYGDLAHYAELVDRYDAVPVLEPMTGNMNDLSPFVDEASTRRMMEECESVAESWRSRNPRLYRAFDAMARYSRNRLERQEFEVLPAK